MPEYGEPARGDVKESFFRGLREFADAESFVFDGESFSYAHLARQVDSWAAYLMREGVTAGTVTALEGECSPHSCAALLALIRVDAIVVPLGPLPEEKRREFLDIAEVESVVRAAGSGEKGVEHTGVRADHELYGRLRAVGHPGLVLFSSGTTGRSKASVLDFVKALNRYGNPAKPRRILSFLSLDHIGGINTLLHTLSQGGAVITVPERTPTAVFGAIERHRAEILPTTPTFLNMALIAGALERYDCSSLELVTYGTEPMPIQTLRRLSATLPAGTRLKQTYGLSELGILPTRSKGDDTLWVRIGGAGFEHKIIDDVLWIRSDMAMLGYLNAPAPFDSEGYFNTQDVVRVDGDYLHILGRRSEIINVGGEKVYPSEVEGVVLEAGNIADVTVSSLSSPVTGAAVKATVRLVTDEDPAAVARRVRKHCRERLEMYKVPVTVEVSQAVQHSERFKKVRT